MNFFSKLNYNYFGYFNPTNKFFDDNFYNFRADLSNTSAETAKLVAICVQGRKGAPGEGVALLR